MNLTPLQCAVCGGLPLPEVDELKAKVRKETNSFVGKPINSQTIKSMTDALININLDDLKIPDEFYCTCRIGD